MRVQLGVDNDPGPAGLAFYMYVLLLHGIFMHDIKLLVVIPCPALLLLGLRVVRACLYLHGLTIEQGPDLILLLMKKGQTGGPGEDGSLRSS